MLIDDRVGFACTFLSDSDLIEYINQLTDTVCQMGDLTGIMLTGTRLLIIRYTRFLRVLIQIWFV